MSRRFHAPAIAVLLLGAAGLLLATGCVGRPRAALRLPLQALESPAGAGSTEPSLAVAPDGRVFLAWMDALDDGEHALRLASRSRAGAWSEPMTVTQGAGFFANWADVPSLLAHPDGSLWAHWLTRSGAGKYAYDVRLARSADGGRSWSSAVVPHRDGTQSEHGFVSLVPWAEGVGVVWLDGRAMSEKAGGQTALMFTAIGPDGSAGDEVVLDPRVCDCCRTAAAVSKGAVSVVYRDRTDAEVRDISLVRREAGRWTAPVDATGDGWRIDGCPVNGPALAASEAGLVLAWFAAPFERGAVKLAFSADGRRFGAGVRADLGRPLGRVDVAPLPGGAGALVSWLEQQGTAARVMVRHVRSDGTKGEAVVVAESSAARASGFPRMLRAGSEVVFAWTDAGDVPRVRTSVARLDGGD